MINKHPQQVQDENILYYILVQRIYFEDPHNPIEVSKRGPYETSPAGLMAKIQSISAKNLAMKSLALEMNDPFFTQVIIIKE